MIASRPLAAGRRPSGEILCPRMSSFVENKTHLDGLN